MIEIPLWLFVVMLVSLILFALVAAIAVLLIVIAVRTGAKKRRTNLLS